MTNLADELEEDLRTNRKLQAIEVIGKLSTLLHNWNEDDFDDPNRNENGDLTANTILLHLMSAIARCANDIAPASDCTVYMSKNSIVRKYVYKLYKKDHWINSFIDYYDDEVL